MKQREVSLQIEDAFRPVVLSQAFRQFPVWGDGTLEDASELFDLDWRRLEPNRLDRFLDLWLCVSPEGFRGATRPFLQALVHRWQMADESTVLANFLSCIDANDPHWLSTFSDAELSALRNALAYLAEVSPDTDDYLNMVSEVDRVRSA